MAGSVPRRSEARPCLPSRNCEWTPIEPAGTCPGYGSLKLGGSEDPWTAGAHNEYSTIGGGCLERSRGGEVEGIDRMYLDVYVPHLQTVGAVVGYLRGTCTLCDRSQ